MCVCVCVCVFVYVYILGWMQRKQGPRNQHCFYGVVSASRIDKIIGLFCKRALKKRQNSAKETYNSIDPTDRSHPIAATVHFVSSCALVMCMMRMVVNVCVSFCVQCALVMGIM